ADMRRLGWHRPHPHPHSRRISHPLVGKSRTAVTKVRMIFDPGARRSREPDRRGGGGWTVAGALVVAADRQRNHDSARGRYVDGSADGASNPRKSTADLQFLWSCRESNP